MQGQWVRWLFIGIASLLALSLLARIGQVPPAANEIGYSKFLDLVANGQVAEVTLRGREVFASLQTAQAPGAEGEPKKSVVTRVPEFGSEGLIDRLENKKVDIRVEETREGVGNWLLYLLPWLVLIGIYVWIWRRMAGAGGGPFAALGQTRAKEVSPEAPTATFDDVAGQDAAKKEVSEVVDFLHEPRRYLRLGAKVPHGILMVGPPGTGKTLTARALAGEAGVPFFYMSGSEFIEMVVGVGAARVRKTFEAARKKQPSILFIDEIDAVGRVRGAGLGGGHDEREQTLNQILDCMDGFGSKEAMIVLAATNRPDVLDPALLRPGRFDRRVTFELPDLAARKKILEVHTRAIPLAEDVDLSKEAAATPGFSGADLQNLANEAAMLAAREHSDKVSARLFDEARDKITMGTARPLTIRPNERRRLAVHESGHAAVAHYLANTDPLHKVTIVPRGQALGGTHQLPEEERYTLSQSYLNDRLAVTLAGRAAEQVFLGDVSSGADDDIRQATRLARAMVSRWGMDKKLGPIDLRAEEDSPFLGLEMAKHRVFSDKTAHEVDRSVQRLLSAAEERAINALERNKAAVARLTAKLEEAETLDRAQIEECLDDKWTETDGDQDTSRHSTRRSAMTRHAR